MDRRLIDPPEDEHVKVDLDPADAVKLVRRLRRVSLFIRSGVELVTDRDAEAGTYRSYDMSDNIRVPASEALRHLRRLVEFNERKSAAGKATGLVPVTRLGSCLFIG